MHVRWMQDGKAIKMLATTSRLDIEDFLQKKVYLEVVTSSSLVMWLIAVDFAGHLLLQCN